MVLEIISHTPLWVFAVFAVLVYRGIVATRDRALQAAPLVLLACAFLFLGGQGALAIAHGSAAPLGVWALAFVTSVLVAMKTVPDSMVYGSREAPMQRGSLASLVLILAIFATRYSVAVASAMHPDQLSGFAASTSLCALYGVTSGVVIGRALRVLMLSMRLPSTLPAGVAA